MEEGAIGLYIDYFLHIGPRSRCYFGLPLFDRNGQYFGVRLKDLGDVPSLALTQHQSIYYKSSSLHFSSKTLSYST